MSAPSDKTLPVTALVSPSSAFSSFLTFSAQECLAQVGGTASEVEEERLCVNLARPESVERCTKVKLSDAAQIEKWRDCLLNVHRQHEACFAWFGVLC